MQNNIENNFEELLRKKLENHSLPVDDALWQGVQTKMAAKKRIAFPIWLRYSAAAVAVLVAVSLLFVDLPQKQHIAQDAALPKTNEIMADTTAIGNESDIEKTIESEYDNSFIKQSVKAKSLANAANKSTKSKSETLSNKTSKPIALNTSSTNNSVELEVLSENNDRLRKPSENSNTTTEKLPQADDSKTLKRNNAELQEAHKAWDDPKAKKTKRRGWFIAANMSTGATSAQVGGGMKTYAAESGIVKAPAAAANYMLSPSDFSSKSFAAPLSAGISLARSISDVLSIETGISYSQLNTKLTDRGLNADLNLHYLGVPVTLMANVIQVSKFKIYASGGAMVEKGIYSNYTQEQVRGSQRINTSVADRVDGLQYSLNAAIGAAYAIEKNLELYFEPRYSFYFDNNQPISIRTNNAAIVGFHAGVRFEIQ